MDDRCLMLPAILAQQHQMIRSPHPQASPGSSSVERLRSRQQQQPRDVANTASACSTQADVVACSLDPCVRSIPGSVGSVGSSAAAFRLGCNRASWSYGSRALSLGLDATRAYASKTKIEYVTIDQPRWDAYTLPPTNFVQLLSALGVAPSIERLLELTEPEMLSRFDAVHVSAALTRLPKVLTYRSKDLKDTDVVMPQSSGILRKRPIDGTLPRSSSREQAGLLANKLCAMLPGHTRRMYPRQAANCIWALGTLHSKGVIITDARQVGRRSRGKIDTTAEGTNGAPSAPAENASRDTLEGLVQRMGSDNMSRSFAHAYASLLEVVSSDSFSALRVHGQPCEAVQLLKGMALLPRSCQAYTVVAGLSRFVAERCGQFQARELRVSAWAIATMSDARRNGGSEGLTAAGDALSAIAKRSCEVSREFTPAGIATIMWAFAACKGNATELVPKDHVKELFTTLAEGIQPQVVMVTAQDIAMILWACAKMKHSDASLVDLLATKAVRHLESFKPLELARTLLAMTELRMPHAELFSAVVRSVSREREIDASIELGVVAMTMDAFASGGLALLAKAAPVEFAVQRVQEALLMLRRLREPLADQLWHPQCRATPDDVVHMAGALKLVLRKEREAGMLSDGEFKGDVLLVQAVTGRMEALVPACSPWQLAGMLSGVEGLRFDGLMLAAAASSQMKLLLSVDLKSIAAQEKPRAGFPEQEEGVLSGGPSRAGAGLLRHAAAVLHACVQLGLNDAELTAALESLVVTVAAAARGGLESSPSSLIDIPSPKLLVQLLCDCHPGGAGSGASRRELRGAVSRMLPLASGVPASPGQLVQALSIYASGIVVSMAAVKVEAAAAAAAARNSPVGAAAEGDSAAVSDVEADIAALEILADALLRQGPLSTRLGAEDVSALAAALPKAVTCARAVESSKCSRLLELELALSAL